MVFHGFQKLTLLDFPGRVACTVFTGGCNFRCPFCHNALLVEGGAGGERIPAAEVLAYLEKRRGILDGICVTGGEPLLSAGLPDFLREVRVRGFAVKLDTNGSFPDRLAALIDEGLLDYVAMDVKNCIEKYALTAACSAEEVDRVEKSIDLLLSGAVDYEFRTTVVHPLHTVEDIRALAHRIRGARRYFLQEFRDSGSLLGEGMKPISPDIMAQMRTAAAEILPSVALRG